MAYEWDVFLSYPRAPQVQPWVEKHFLPVLRGHLDGLLTNEPTIFVDSAQPTGVDWPDNIKHALLHSRIMIAVWTPPYFRSEWCMAEWESMIAREERLRQRGGVPANGLVYPVVFSDGKNFHDRAKRTQAKDLSAFTYPYDCFRESREYMAFHDAVFAVAEEIEARLGEAPEWQPDFPLANIEAIAQTGPRVKLLRF